MATALKKKPKQEVARRAASTLATQEGLPAHLRSYESTGAGVPSDAKDFLLPMAKVLDAKSPECEKRGPNYVPGAEAGDILLKNAPNPLIKGDQGFLFQPCYREAAVIEWLPRTKGGGGGGGFVARHPEDYLETSNDKVQRPHPENPAKMVWYRKSTGNLLVETRYVGGYMVGEDGDEPLPLVLPFSSTGHTVAKQWNMLIASKRVNGAKADIWLVYYRVATRLKARQDQSWYLFDVADAGPERNGLPTTMWVPTAEDAERGRNLHESLASGARQFAQDEGPADNEKM